jgi:Twin arginine targeting (Tat) protein translocase TatC
MRDDKTAEPSPDQEQPFLSHLLELRDRLLRSILGVLLVFLALFPFADDLYTLLAGPLLAHLPEGSTMIAIEVASPFLTPFKLTLVLSVFVSMPFILYQIWAFIAPGLYRNERRVLMPFLLSSSVLFYVGMAFAYFVVFPLAFAFLTGAAPEGVTVMTDINKYLDFVLTFFFVFGIAFEVPIATLVLVFLGITTPDHLSGKRPYVIVGAFAVGMVLTPPDVVSQTLLAIPLWLLFELGVILARVFVPKERWEEEQTIEVDHRAAAAGASTLHAPFNEQATAAEPGRIETGENTSQHRDEDKPTR